MKKVENVLFLLFLILFKANCDSMGAESEEICCSTCPEDQQHYSPPDADHFKMFVLNAIKTNMSIEEFAGYFKRFP